jgi:hypothetical protein
VHWVLYIYGRKSFPLGWCRGAKFIDCLIDDFTFKWRRKCWGIKIVSYLNRRGHNNEKRWLCGSGGEERAGVCIRYKKAGDLYIDRIQYNFVGSNLMTVWINVSDTLFSLPPFSFCLIHVASKLRLMTWSCKFFYISNQLSFLVHVALLSWLLDKRNWVQQSSSLCGWVSIHFSNALCL